jgi:succinate dehydrogenase/fumarate reductase flavoprotein subunit
VAGAGVLGATPALAQTPTPSNGLPATWDLTADVVVIGSGGAGLPAALAAQSKGASVIVVEMNYDVGGHAIVSGGTTDLGGGTPAQDKWGVKDTPDLVFKDLTLNVASQSGLFQDRAMTRVYADNNVAAFNFLVANGMQFSDFMDGGPRRSARATGLQRPRLRGRTSRRGRVRSAIPQASTAREGTMGSATQGLWKPRLGQRESSSSSITR